MDIDKSCKNCVFGFLNTQIDAIFCFVHSDYVSSIVHSCERQEPYVKPEIPHLRFVETNTWITEEFEQSY